MPKYRTLFALFAVITIGSALTAYSFKGQEMQEIKFDLGKNIVETARLSGVPSFSTDNMNGLISYSVNNIPSQIPARFVRPGYEVTVGPLWAFTMDADHAHGPNDIAESVNLQIGRGVLESHDVAQAFAEQLIGQFQKGKWQRYIKDSEPAVTGRSSILDEDGQLSKKPVQTLDPLYKLSREEWKAISTKIYHWVGDGVIAELTISYGDNPATGVMYQMFLEFELADVQQKRNAQANADAIKEGEANGWNTAAKYAANKIKIEARNKLLEANALKRGDAVVPR